MSPVTGRSFAPISPNFGTVNPKAFKYLSLKFQDATFGLIK